MTLVAMGTEREGSLFPAEVSAFTPVLWPERSEWSFLLIPASRFHFSQSRLSLYTIPYRLGMNPDPGREVKGGNSHPRGDQAPQEKGAYCKHRVDCYLCCGFE